MWRGIRKDIWGDSNSYPKKNEAGIPRYTVKGRQPIWIANWRPGTGGSMDVAGVLHYAVTAGLPVCRCKL